MNAIIPPEEWSRDHWTLIAYAASRIGQGGELERERLRMDGTKFPTRTRSGKVAGHNDLDCLVDAAEAGVLRNIGTGSHPAVQFTPAGLVLGQWLCRGMATRSIVTSALTWESATLSSGFKFVVDAQTAAGELAQIDAVMARVPALDKPTRWQNVQHAILTAKHADELQARLGQLEAQLARVKAAPTPPSAVKANQRLHDSVVKANQRLHDLVRHQRWALHNAGLISDEEYAALAGEHGAVARLEDYDRARAEVGHAPEGKP